LKKRPGLLFYCQHTRGIGHLVRSLALAAELGRRFRVVLLSGGKIPRCIAPPPGVEVVRLPPVEMSVDNRLLSSDGRRTLARTMELRRTLILDTFEQLRPAAVVTELYPFGRFSFSGELLPLLEAARGRKPNRPLVFSALRDVLEQSDKAQPIINEIACVICNHLYDAVLFHADPSFTRFEESFRTNTPLTTPVVHTGFVVPWPGARPNAHKGNGHEGEGRVVVSAGGGRVGGQLLLRAAEAYARYGIGEGVGMTITTGPFLPPEDWRALKTTAAGVKGLRLQRWLPDLHGVLSRARGSVSQCGYNTSMELLRSRVPALVVPFVGPADREQMRRARRMAGLGLARVLEPERADAATLAREIRALLEFRPRAAPVDFGGAENSAAVIENMLRGRPPRRPRGSDVEGADG
jgi:predicted glycosyltransferase